ncbi:MAG: hypothetical protein ACOC0P_08035 [Planctomycetota bacterium]
MQLLSGGICRHFRHTVRPGSRPPVSRAQITHKHRQAGTPDEPIAFVYGFTSGSAKVPLCPGLQVDIRAPQIAGLATTDANGRAEFTTFIPRQASGRQILIQSVDQTRCRVSDVLVFEF